MLYISKDELVASVTPSDAIDAMSHAFSDLGNGLAYTRHRTHTYVPLNEEGLSLLFKSMEGGLPSIDTYAIRIAPYHNRMYTEYGTERKRAVPAARGGQFCEMVILFQISTTEPFAILQGGEIQALRVAATSALAAKYMARQNSTSMGLIGSGHQAVCHARCYAAALPLTKISLFSPNREHRESVAAKLSAELDFDVEPVTSARAAVEGHDVVVTATDATEPVLSGEWLSAGTHLTYLSAGDGSVARREVDDDTVARADRFYITDISVVRPWKQQLILNAEARGQFVVEELPTLSDVVTGKLPGRETDTEITVYNANIGLGFQFAALGYAAWKRASESGVGTEIPTEWFLQPMRP